MGIVSDVIDRAYIKAWLNSDNVPTASAEVYCDEIYQELIDIKKLTNESYIKAEHYITTVPYQNEYDLPSDFEKMTLVSIRYTVPSYDDWATGTVYATGDKVVDSGKAYVCISAHTAGGTFAGDSANWKQIWEWYKTCDEQVEDYNMKEDYNSSPFDYPTYFYDNNKIYVYPRPKEAVVDGLHLDYIPVSTTIDTSTDDADIHIEAKLRKHREMWLAMKMRAHIRDTDWEATLLVKYERWKELCEDRWTRRHYNKQKQTLPNSLTRYMR